jgi:hypothetical protein
VAESERDKVIYIVGSAGSGKSTLMKMLAKSRDAEILPCSTDITSADIVILKDEKTVLVDATLPHILQPRFPALIGQVFDTSRFLDRQKLVPHKQKLIELAEKKSKLYTNIYAYLAASYKVYEVKNNVEYDKAKLTLVANEIHNDFIKNQPSLQQRAAFCSYLDEGGYKSLLDMCSVQKKVCVKCCLEKPAFELMAQLVAKSGKGVHVYSSAYVPGACEAITVGNISICINPKEHCEYVIDLDLLLGLRAEKTHEKAQRQLIEAAGVQFGLAKAAHLEIEEIYKQAMNFDEMLDAGKELLN